MRQFQILAMMTMLLFLGWCKPKPTETPRAHPEKAGYIRRFNSDTVIVFVHGIFGGPESTWTNDETHAYWPTLLVQDGAFGNSDIYVLGYDSPFFSPTYTFDNLIENTRLRLQDAEVFSKHAHVVFVCHSMGGLIIRGLLSRYDDLRKKVPLIYFVSTPTDGSHIAKIAQLVSQNPQIRVLGPLPPHSDSILAMLQGNWRAMHNIPLSKCAYETLDTYHIRVVDPASASALCDGPLDPINENHIGIAKPTDSQATVYVAFRQAFLNRPSVVQNAEENFVEGHIDTLRKVDVDCGEVQQSPETEIDPPFTVQQGQRLKEAIVSLQQATNLKFGEASGHGLREQRAVFSYRIEGLDKAADHSCAGKGLGVILIAFVLTQPRSMPLPAGFQALTAGDQSLVLLSRTGSVKIDNVEAVKPVLARSATDRFVLMQQVSRELGHYSMMVNVVH